MATVYDKSSLFLAPSGVDNGTVFSQKPVGGTGDFTFTRGSNLSATRVNEAQLIEKGRENLVLRSNAFNSFPWSTSASDATSGQSGYDGSNDAWLLSKTAINGRAQQNLVVTGVQTFSVYAKAGTNTWMNLLINGSVSPSVFFDLQNGVLGSVTSSTIEAKIVSVGNGWYRCSATFNATTSRYRIYVSDGNNDNTGTSGNIFIQDAQVELGLVSTSVIETGATTAKAGLLESTPRLDYSGGATCPSLLLEPSRANLMNSSEYLRAPYWSEGGLDSLQSNVSTTADPTGGYGASKIIPNSTNTTAHSIIGNDVSTSTQYTASIFAKAAEYDYLWIRGLGLGGNGGARFNISTGVVEGFSDFASATIEDYGNGWYRCIATGTTPPATTTGPFYHPSPTASFTAYAGDGTSGIYTYGAQVEAAPYATSYIPTYGTSQTRSNDSTADLDTSSILTQSNNNTYFAEVVNHRNTGNTRFIASYDSARNNGDRILIYSGNASTSYTLHCQYKVSGEASIQFNIATNVNYGDTIKFAVVFNGTEMIGFANGVKTATATIVDADNFNKFDITDTASELGVFKQLLLFPTALSDLDARILTGATTYETFDEMALALNYTVYE